MSKEPISVVLTVNGEDNDIKVEATDTLVDVLRERLGLTGTKIMCNLGECGSCTILMDGTPVSSCLVLAVECEEKDILTIEGLANLETGTLDPIQDAFVVSSGMQCGICTPGMILTAKALLEENPTPSEDDIREAISGNLCRCGNYNRITESIMSAADHIRGGA
ncbi:MAG: (2Fe-2S)-binding protein [Deltaproteobacteria bacterium]|nr:(2Fe-2S)-binding protein [Deltaproteobacteria bacterium]